MAHLSPLRINAAVALQKPIPALKVDIVPLLQIKADSIRFAKFVQTNLPKIA